MQSYLANQSINQSLGCIVIKPPSLQPHRPTERHSPIQRRRDPTAIAQPSLLLLIILSRLPHGIPLRIPLIPTLALFQIRRVLPRRELDRGARRRDLIGSLGFTHIDGITVARVLDVGRGCRVGEDLRPDTHADEIGVFGADGGELEVEVCVCVFEVADQALGAAAADGVAGRAGGSRELEHRSCAGDVLVILEADVEDEFFFFGWDCGVVPAEDAGGADGVGSAVAHPYDVPVETVRYGG